MSDARFFNDEPFLDDNGPDLLGREQYARHAVELLGRVRAQTETGVLALIGSWGSGKSTVLGKVMRLLQGQDRRETWLIAELNPWLYSDLESLTAALFSEIRAALPKGRRWSEVRKRLGGFGQAISPLGKLTALAGLDSEGLIKAFSDRINGDTSASAAKRKAEEALRQAGQPVLVVMDDLDRLTPDELLLVFKLVRLVGHLPNVYYLIGFDEQTLLDVLQRSDLVGNSEPRAREFLEKIIQVRLDLPAFRERDAAAMSIRALNAILDSHNLSMTPGEEQRFSEAHFRHLQDRLQTPRAVKRYFGQADATLGSLVGDVDLVDFLIVTFLRTNEPGAYRLLRRHRAELTGTSLDPSQRRNAQQLGERADRWRNRLGEAGVAAEHVEGVLRLLGQLFPTVQQDLGMAGDAKAAAQRRGIGSTDYFDRYMVFGVPDDDLPEAVFDQALAQLAADAPEEEAAELLLRLREDTHRVTRRIEQRRNTGSPVPVPAAALLKAMADTYGQTTAEPEMMGLVNSGMSLQFLARDLLTDLPPEQRPPVLAAMAATPDGAILATRTLHRATNPDNNDSEHVQTTEDWSLHARDAVAERIAQHLAPSTGRPAEELTDSDTDLIWMWRHTNPDTLRPWLHQRLDNGWELLPLLGKLIQPASHPFPLIDHPTLAGLDAMFGLDDLYTHLEPFIHASTGNGPADEHQANILQALRERRPTTGQTPPANSATT
ncbi:P-loop NTPase fold protein [Streptomyces sp. NBC_00996]|uniref:KAP family P-loop NTPase fold protein n=1 Tax=Streptomyces sp. NBC_00996 TaxID=2903710 RepID=UPI00386E45F7|nr:KAP family NTPase [Streptomyces sp. NBC_00996]WSW80066.1 KAP family NTPase [Streptomyces sp. NBC_00996]